MDKVYGWWRHGWVQRADGSIIHSPYPQVIAAEKRDQGGVVREILADGMPGETVSKAVRPQADKMVRRGEDK
jgi:hypothetical protein